VITEVNTGSIPAIAGYDVRKIKIMHFWRKDFFETLNKVAAEANKTPEWSDYATFCVEYERGLRKKAFAILDRFISVYERASFADRRRFVSWLLYQAEGREGRHMLLPHQLNVRLIEPTLLEWTMEDPDCSEPHRWLGGSEHLKQAIELDPTDEIARRKLIVWVMSQVSDAVHELPFGYLGNPFEDLALLADAEKLAADLQNEKERDLFVTEIKAERKSIEDHLLKKKQ
jgi:hypothetical protein